MTTTTLTNREECAMPPRAHRSVREIVGWNRRAAIYWAGVGMICLILEKIHP